MSRIDLTGVYFWCSYREGFKTMKSFIEDKKFDFLWIFDSFFGNLITMTISCRFRVIFVQVVPCISLVILNILLFSAMRRAEQRRRRLTINRTNNNEKRNASTAAANTKAKRGTIGRWDEKDYCHSSTVLMVARKASRESSSVEQRLVQRKMTNLT